MSSFNKVTLLGRIGNDPDYTPGEGDKSSYVRFSLATNDGWGDNEKTNWHNIKVFGQRADFVGTYKKKGELVLVEGALDYSQWENDEGEVKYMTSIIARDVVSMPRSTNTAGATAEAAEDSFDDVPF